MSEEEVPFLAPEQRRDLDHDPEEALTQAKARRLRRWEPRRVFGIVAACVAVALIVLSALYRGLGVFHAYSEKAAADQQWISTSNSAWDQFFCRWVSICGGVNWLHYSEPSALGKPEQLVPPRDWSREWIDPAAGRHPEEQWDKVERAKRDIPQYVLDYAPLLYLHPEERYWPSDPAEHLAHSEVRIGNDERQIEWNLSLATLGKLNDVDGATGGEDVFITSLDDPESRPEWMLSRVNIPGWNGSSSTASRSTDEQDSDVSDPRAASFSVKASSNETVSGMRSNAPAILIIVEKDSGTLDAFWFFFNSFNEGNTVFGMRFGNHVGDWEHVMVRFVDGLPNSLYLSRHSWGSAFTYEAMEKIGRRPVVYSGNGSHAHYPTAGPQPYVLPFGLLKDVTSHGPLWDPSLNFHSYTYELPSSAPLEENGVFRASILSPRAPTSWLEYAGHWGDHVYSLADWRQYRFFGEFHYSSGPTGPRDKRLERKSVCDNPSCEVKDLIL